MSTQELQISENMIASAPATSAAVSRRVANNMWEAVASYLYRRALRRAERELMSLDDRMLHDIGITRSEIPSAVRKARENLLMPIVPH
jgi:uncharacterized protein YjiS (DUF1127 family)